MNRNDTVSQHQQCCLRFPSLLHFIDLNCPFSVVKLVHVTGIHFLQTVYVLLEKQLNGIQFLPLLTALSTLQSCISCFYAFIPL